MYSRVSSGASATATTVPTASIVIADGQQPLGVGLRRRPGRPARAHQQRHHDAREHAAEQQLVDDVGQRVGHA